MNHVLFKLLPLCCEFVHDPFKSWFSISHSSLTLQDISPTGFKARFIRTPLRYAGPPGWEAWCTTQTTHSSETTFIVVTSLLLVGCHTRSVNSNWTVSLPFLVVLMWSFLYIRLCGKSFLLVFNLLSEIVVFYVVIVLVCLWEEVNSRSPYSIPLWLLKKKKQPWIKKKEFCAVGCDIVWS